MATMQEKLEPRNLKEDVAMKAETTENEVERNIALAYAYRQNGNIAAAEKIEYRTERLGDDDPDISMQISDAYRFGSFGLINIIKANEWLEKAALLGNGHSQHELGLAYRNGYFGYQVDLEVSKKWLDSALDKMHPETCLLRAVELINSKKNMDEAIRLLKHAAASGSGHALEALEELKKDK